MTSIGYVDELDGHMDHVHELRDLYAADVVHLVTGIGNVCGIANLNFTESIHWS